MAIKFNVYFLERFDPVFWDVWLELELNPGSPGHKATMPTVEPSQPRYEVLLTKKQNLMELSKRPSSIWWWASIRRSWLSIWITFKFLPTPSSKNPHLPIRADHLLIALVEVANWSLALTRVVEYLLLLQKLAILVTIVTVANKKILWVFIERDKRSHLVDFRANWQLLYGKKSTWRLSLA